jgi:outer membrane murein-binding lipoprotein Lpp
MMKQTLIAPVLLGATLLTGQSPAPARQASLDDLVSEVRGLRADIQQMADSSIRAQLLVARLQVQEQRIAGIAKQLADTDEQLARLEGARNPFLTKMLKDMQAEPPSDPGEADLLAGMKAQLEKVENGDPVLKERQATLSRLLAEEQARWVAFNAQLEELERRVTGVKGR